MGEWKKSKDGVPYEVVDKFEVERIVAGSVLGPKAKRTSKSKEKP